MKYLFIFTLLLSSKSFALTKAQALQVAKNRIEILSVKVPVLSYSCFVYEEDCNIKTNLQGVVLKLISNERSKFPAVIQYASGKENFFIDGAIRIAKTGNTWGAPVIFNEDLLVRETEPGNFEALDFFEILGILVHEFGHHQEDFWVSSTGQAFLKHEELDEIAAKVVTYLKDRTRKIKITQDEIADLPKEQDISIYQIDIEQNIGVRLRWSNIFIDSMFETVEVSADLVRGVVCPRGYSNGHLTFVGEPANAAFRQVLAPQFHSEQSSLQISQKVGDASVLCIDRRKGKFDVFNGYTEGKLNYVFTLSEGRYMYSGASSFTAKAPPDSNSF